jgi:hypothetical protein
MEHSVQQINVDWHLKKGIYTMCYQLSPHSFPEIEEVE